LSKHLVSQTEINVLWPIVEGLPLWECLTAGCKAFSLANGKKMGTNDWVIKSLD
jgi:hypothetical protein